MVVYHGSNSNFKKLRIAKELVQHENTKTNEGMGIYFSTDIEVARSYGKYIYTLEINDEYFRDFRKRIVCKSYVAKIVREIRDKTNINIAYFIDIDSLVDRMYYGGQSISKVGHEIYMLLDSNENWCKFPQYRIKRVYQMLRGYDRKPPKVYTFNYHIKNIGVIKDVSDEVVRIVNKEKAY